MLPMDSKHLVGAVDPHLELGISLCPIDAFCWPVFVDRDEYAARFAPSRSGQEASDGLTALRRTVRLELDRFWNCHSRWIFTFLDLCHDLYQKSCFSNQTGRADSARTSGAYNDSEKDARMGSGRYADGGKTGRAGGIDTVVLCCERGRVNSVFLWTRGSAV